MLELDVRGLRKVYGHGDSAITAIDDLTFGVETGEFLCIVGPSGCGKTTLLKVVSGLLPPTSGTAHLAGRQIVGPPDELALVFQDYSRSLLPWMTVWKNVTLPLLANGIDKAERTKRASDALAAVGLVDFHDRHPWQLSGGMQQKSRHRPGAGLSAEDASDGRAVRFGRCPDPGGPRGPGSQGSCAVRDHGRVRYP